MYTYVYFDRSLLNPSTTEFMKHLILNIENTIFFKKIRNMFGFFFQKWIKDFKYQRSRDGGVEFGTLGRPRNIVQDGSAAEGT